MPDPHLAVRAPLELSQPSLVLIIQTSQEPVFLAAFLLFLVIEVHRALFWLEIFDSNSTTGAQRSCRIPRRCGDGPAGRLYGRIA